MIGFWILKSWTGFKICRNVAEYVWMGGEYALKCLSSARSLYKVMSTYWEILRDTHSEPGQRSKMERFGKIVIVFGYLYKKKFILNLWEGSEYVSGFKYGRVLNTPKFS